MPIGPWDWESREFTGDIDEIPHDAQQFGRAGGLQPTSQLNSAARTIDGGRIVSVQILCKSVTPPLRKAGAVRGLRIGARRLSEDMAPIIWFFPYQRILAGVICVIGKRFFCCR